MSTTAQIVRQALAEARAAAREKMAQQRAERLEREKQREAEEREIVEATRPPLTEHHRALIARRDELAARIPSGEDSAAAFYHHHREIERLDAEIAREERLHREWHAYLIQRERLRRHPPTPTRQLRDRVESASDVMVACVRSAHAPPMPVVDVDGTIWRLHGASSPFTFVTKTEAEQLRPALEHDAEARQRYVRSFDQTATLADCRAAILIEQWHDIYAVLTALRGAAPSRVDPPPWALPDDMQAARALVANVTDVRCLIRWQMTAEEQGDRRTVDIIQQRLSMLDVNGVAADAARTFWLTELAASDAA